jgi:hypothetical protein
MPLTVIHSTHEAVQKVGGIGTVLDGLLTSSVYQKAVQRSILVGPLTHPREAMALANQGEVLFSSLDGTGQGRVAKLLGAVEVAHNVNMVYGKRRFGNGAEAEVLLIDAGDVNPRKMRNFKYNLYQHFGLASDRYDHVDDYALYVDCAEATYDALVALLGQSKGPHVVLGHEYMGMPLVLKTLMVNDPRFRAIFYAHEVATMRGIVESAPGHDTMFYNTLRTFLEQGSEVTAAFGNQSDNYRHALIEKAHHCDGIFAVGDPVVDELKFLGEAFQAYPIDLVYNGLPADNIGFDERLAAWNRMRNYSAQLLGTAPDVVMTHVTRPVVSKGLWRDFRVLEHLDNLMAAQNRTGVFFVLTSAAGKRSYQDIEYMEQVYGWPLSHRLGAPDLVGPEADIWANMEAFNGRAKAIRAILVNQFGWDRASCGQRMLEDMTFMDLRKGTDIEFGQSIYEPFGIAVLEPLGFGAVCVPSSVCGCCGFLSRVTQGQGAPNVVVSDYVSLDSWSLSDPRAIGLAERNHLEAARGESLAWEIMGRLPNSDEDRALLLENGLALAEQMSWDAVCRDYFLPGIQRAINRRSGND